jgi:hypothetical protein
MERAAFSSNKKTRNTYGDSEKQILIGLRTWRNR